VERSADVTVAAFRVEGVGHREGVGIELQHRTQLGPPDVDRLDPGQVRLGEGTGDELARGHPRAELGDRHLLDVDVRHVIPGPAPGRFP